MEKDKGGKMKHKAYFVRIAGENWGWAVVAVSAREAKKIAWEEGDWGGDIEFIDLRVNWNRKANIEGLSIGLIDPDENSEKRGLYSEGEK